LFLLEVGLELLQFRLDGLPYCRQLLLVLLVHQQGAVLITDAVDHAQEHVYVGTLLQGLAEQLAGGGSGDYEFLDGAGLG